MCLNSLKTTEHTILFFRIQRQEMNKTCMIHSAFGLRLGLCFFFHFSHQHILVSHPKYPAMADHLYPSISCYNLRRPIHNTSPPVQQRWNQGFSYPQWLSAVKGDLHTDHCHRSTFYRTCSSHGCCTFFHLALLCKQSESVMTSFCSTFELYLILNIVFIFYLRN